MGNLFTSTIGRKLIMSISGLFLILFLLFHMSMNIAAVFSTEAYNAICEFLGANWYALAGTLILAAGFVVHIIYASILTLRNRAARGDKGKGVIGVGREADVDLQPFLREIALINGNIEKRMQRIGVPVKDHVKLPRLA